MVGEARRWKSGEGLIVERLRQPETKVPEDGRGLPCYLSLGESPFL